MSAVEVSAAAAALVDDFGHGRVEEYFARIAPDATFVFHTSDVRLESRDAYRRLWERWQAEDGLRVISCASSDVLVQMVGDLAAVVSHEVATRVATNDGEEDVRERESIVFARRDGEWLVVHEHLSPR